MTAERVRDYLHAMPFIPFSVHLADGRSFLVDHPDFATLMGDNRHFFVNYDDGKTGRHAIVDLELVTRVEAASHEEA